MTRRGNTTQRSIRIAAGELYLTRSSFEMLGEEMVRKVFGPDTAIAIIEPHDEEPDEDQ